MTPTQARRSSIVSNSGTRWSEAAPSARTRPTSFKKQRQLQQVRDALGLGDDRGADRAGPVGLADRSGGGEDAEFAARLLAIGDEGRDQRARRSQFPAQEIDPLALRSGACSRGPASRRRAVRRRCAHARRSSASDRSARGGSRTRRPPAAERAAARAPGSPRRGSRATGRRSRDRRPAPRRSRRPARRSEDGAARRHDRARARSWRGAHTCR